MKNYVAQLADNIVTEIFVSDYEWAQANIVGALHDLGAEPLTVGIGYTYDADADVFVAPVVIMEE